MKKPTSNTWHDALKKAVAPEGAPPAPGEHHDLPGAKVPFSTYLAANLAGELRQLSHRLSLEHGRRVSVAELVTEAVVAFLGAHKR
jgi:hypothetical protein